jgi:hypothetical protein
MKVRIPVRLKLEIVEIPFVVYGDQFANKEDRSDEVLLVINCL